MNVFLVPNSEKPNIAQTTAQVAEKFSSFGDVCWMDERGRGQFFSPLVRFADPIAGKVEMNLVVPIGGDGTILHAASLAVSLGCPILGINAGRVGFLTEVEAGDLSLLDRLRTGDYTLSTRMMLSAVHHSTRGKASYQALNDVVFVKGDPSRLADISVEEGGDASRFRADGVIFSTPTGSTAYSLSAGGPIVDPSVETILLTPVCPYSLSSRSLIYAPDKELTVRGLQEGGSSCLQMSVDGGEPVDILPGEWVVISKSSVCVRFINFGKKNFYRVLQEKLSGIPY